jgi:hypothetical protein
VENYSPDLTSQRLEALTHRLVAAADELRREGSDVRLLGSAGLPGDEALLSVLAAPSADIVVRVLEAAGISADRIVPVLWQAGHAS